MARPNTRGGRYYVVEWTPEEEQILRDGCISRLPLKVVAQMLPGRTTGAISRRRVRLGLKTREPRRTAREEQAQLEDKRDDFRLVWDTCEAERAHRALTSYFRRNPEQPNSGKPALVARVSTVNPYAAAANA